MGEATAAGAGMGEAAVGTRMGAAAAGTRGEEPAAAGRVFVVSNRLPVTAARLPSGQWEFKPSSGGLVTALAGVKAQVPFLWVGWLGQEIPPDEQEAVYSELRAKHAAIPVFLPDSIADGYYNRFSNGVLWPLLHYLPGEVVFKEGDWEDYLVASRHFSETLRRLDIRAGDMIWVHDYHLMPLPGILRQVYGPRVKIGFFLHIPFPSSEIFKVLPVCRELLLGLVHADLISFHSYDYARHFSSACAKLLGIVPTVGGFEWNGQMVHVETAPIGIDPDVFLRGLADEQVQLRVADLQRAFEGKRVILGVDRLDYIKGIPNKIAAFRRFLEQHPELRGSVVLVQVAVPSRTDVQEYVDLGTSVFEMAGNCNALYGTADSSPLQLISRSVGYHELSALYQVAEVCLVSSLRDGMNLVAYEYVASQAERHGVLILSEFAGAAQCFGGALFVNPWDLDGMARRLAEALEMPAARREALHAQLFRYTCAHTATRWGQAFVDRLARVGGHRGAGPGVEVCWGEGARADSGPGSAAASPGECECVDREGLGGWGAGVLGIFQLAAGRTPGSRLEVARGSITWSFEYGDREFWSYQAEGLRASLQATGAAEHGQLSVSESSVSLVSTGAERG